MNENNQPQSQQTPESTKALLSEVSTLRSNQAELVAENERRLQAIGKMLTALNECGREIHWNTSNEIEEAYAEMRAIYKSALSGGSKQ